MDMMEQFRVTYLEESFEGLDIMEQGLLNLPIGDPNLEDINTIFRAAHSIKGGSGTFGFSEISGFTHVLETLLDELRDGKRQVTQESVDVMLQAVDQLRRMMVSLQNHDPIDENAKLNVQAQLEAILKGEAPGSAHTSTNGATTLVATSNAQDDIIGWKIKIIPDEDLLQTGNEPIRIIRELENLGKVVTKADLSKLPESHNYQPENLYMSWEIELQGAVPESSIREVFEWIDGDGAVIELTPVRGVIVAPKVVATPAVASSTQTVATAEAPKPAASQAVPTKVAASTSGVDDSKKGPQPDGSIRVNLSKIDHLVNLVGELVITQSMLSQFGEQAENGNGASDWMDKLREGLTHLERHTRELQESVMNIRMLPVSFAFNRMPRIVHDVSQKLGKKIDLVTEGEGTELDKTMLEQLTDPLVHIVRNSIDHGVEVPEVRRAKGKPETGRVVMRAYHQGGNIVIDISDDGAGLNRDKILSKAIEKGLVTQDQTISDEEIYDLIFHAGFSTADVVSDISGRGVGMDVVRRNIRSLGGTVAVDSTKDKGSIFTIRLPLTLAILDGQLASVSRETFVFPLISIVESIQVSKGQFKGIAGESELYKLRNEYIPVVRLKEQFGLPEGDEKDNKGLLVVVESGGHRAGIYVDDLLGQQQVVIKSLETNFLKIRGIAGATILGDGNVALILDVQELISGSINYRNAIAA